MCGRIVKIGLLGLFGCLALSILVAILPPKARTSAPAPAQSAVTSTPETAVAASEQSTQVVLTSTNSMTVMAELFATNTLADAPTPTAAEGGTQAWYTDLETQFADKTPLPTTLPASVTLIPASATSLRTATQIALT